MMFTNMAFPLALPSPHRGYPLSKASWQHGFGLHHVVLYYITLCYTLPSCTVPCYIIIHYTSFYSSSVCANDTKISKPSRRHGAIPAWKFSSHIKSRTLLKSFPECSQEHILSMLVKPPRTWSAYDFEATPLNDCMTTKENRQYIAAWHYLIC